MADIQPKAPTSAQPAEGASQDQAQQLADAIGAALTDVMSKLQKILMALQKMGIDEAQLQEIVQLYEAFEGKVSEALGAPAPEGEEAPEESQPGVVSQEGGVSGKPVA